MCVKAHPENLSTYNHIYMDSSCALVLRMLVRLLLCVSVACNVTHFQVITWSNSSERYRLQSQLNYLCVWMRYRDLGQGFQDFGKLGFVVWRFRVTDLPISSSGYNLESPLLSLCGSLRQSHWPLSCGIRLHKCLWSYHMRQGKTSLQMLTIICRQHHWS